MSGDVAGLGVWGPFLAEAERKYSRWLLKRGVAKMHEETGAAAWKWVNHPSEVLNGKHPVSWASSLPEACDLLC